MAQALTSIAHKRRSDIGKSSPLICGWWVKAGMPGMPGMPCPLPNTTVSINYILTWITVVPVLFQLSMKHTVVGK